MNPLVLIGLGVALFALAGKRKPAGQGPKAGNGAPVPVPVPTPEDHVVEEGEVSSAAGALYATRIWRVYEQPTEYIGELFLDPEGWVGGPAADAIENVRNGLQVLADSLDTPESEWLPLAPCADPLPGPFTAVGYDPAQREWVPYPSGRTFMHDEQPQTGLYWCVVEVIANGASLVEGRVTDESGHLIYRTGPEADQDIAASKAAYVAIKGPNDLPWPTTATLGQ